MKFVACIFAASLGLAHPAPLSKTVLLQDSEWKHLRTTRSLTNGTAPGDFWEGWTSTAPDSTDYNEETTVSWLPVTVEGFLARIFCLCLASAPLLLAALAEEQLTRAHLLESCALMVWLGGTLYLFCNVLKFQSAHWTGTRPLTLVEAVYLMSQILTTVGYGDITPAFPRGQVWVGINVIIALCLYGSMIMEVVGIVQARVAKAAVSDHEDIADLRSRPLKNWLPKVDSTSFFQTVAFFGVMALIGIVFFRNYPGEGKTWFQAVYMSIITLSTVGFGAFTAVTEGGKVFGAFWMLFGVAALGALIGGFVEWMKAQKDLQSFYLADHGEVFNMMLNNASSDGKVLTKSEFFEFAVKLTKGIDEKELHRIKARFAYLKQQDQAKDDWVRRTTLVDFEGPEL